jgi:hypothetical protein
MKYIIDDEDLKYLVCGNLTSHTTDYNVDKFLKDKAAKVEKIGEGFVYLGETLRKSRNRVRIYIEEIK